MKYLSLLLLGSSLVAGARNNGGNTQATNNAGQRAQGASSGQMQAGGIVQGGMSTGNQGAAASNAQGNGNANAQGSQTASAPGNAVSAANVQPGQNPFLALAQGQNTQAPQLSDQQKMGLQMAATLWAQDTAVVSSALDRFANTNMSDQDFRDTADMAYMAEVNELMQKNFIDALLGTMPQLQAASTSLGNGSFAIVVDQLREMRIRGPANQTFVNAAVTGMNNLRCRQVLLAIDAYLQTANQMAGNNSFISSTRPPACGDVYAQTADTLPPGSTVNASTFPTASQLISQFNQAPRFMLSNAVAFSQNSGSDNTPALGSQFSTNAPFTNTSSLSGQLLAFNGQPVQTNGDAANIKANPLNGVLFANNAQVQGGNQGGAQAQNGTGNANQGANQGGNAQQGANQGGNAQQGANQGGNAQQGATGQEAGQQAGKGQQGQAAKGQQNGQADANAINSANLSGARMFRA